MRAKAKSYVEVHQTVKPARVSTLVPIHQSPDDGDSYHSYEKDTLNGNIHGIYGRGGGVGSSYFVQSAVASAAVISQPKQISNYVLDRFRTSMSPLRNASSATYIVNNRDQKSTFSRHVQQETQQKSKKRKQQQQLAEVELVPTAVAADNRGGQIESDLGAQLPLATVPTKQHNHHITNIASETHSESDAMEKHSQTKHEDEFTRNLLKFRSNSSNAKSNNNNNNNIVTPNNINNNENNSNNMNNNNNITSSSPQQLLLQSLQQQQEDRKQLSKQSTCSRICVLPKFLSTFLVKQQLRFSDGTAEDRFMFAELSNSSTSMASTFVILACIFLAVAIINLQANINGDNMEDSQGEFVAAVSSTSYTSILIQFTLFLLNSSLVFLFTRQITKLQNRSKQTIAIIARRCSCVIIQLIQIIYLMNIFFARSTLLPIDSTTAPPPTAPNNQGISIEFKDSFRHEVLKGFFVQFICFPIIRQSRFLVYEITLSICVIAGTAGTLYTNADSFWTFLATLIIHSIVALSCSLVDEKQIRRRFKSIHVPSSLISGGPIHLNNNNNNNYQLHLQPRLTNSNNVLDGEIEEEDGLDQQENNLFKCLHANCNSYQIPSNTNKESTAYFNSNNNNNNNNNSRQLSQNNQASLVKIVEEEISTGVIVVVPQMQQQGDIPQLQQPSDLEVKFANHVSFKQLNCLNLKESTVLARFKEIFISHNPFDLTNVVVPVVAGAATATATPQNGERKPIPHQEQTYSPLKLKSTHSQPPPHSQQHLQQQQQQQQNNKQSLYDLLVSYLQEIYEGETSSYSNIKSRQNQKQLRVNNKRQPSLLQSLNRSITERAKLHHQSSVAAFSAPRIIATTENLASQSRLVNKERHQRGGLSPKKTSINPIRNSFHDLNSNSSGIYQMANVPNNNLYAAPSYQQQQKQSAAATAGAVLQKGYTTTPATAVLKGSQPKNHVHRRFFGNQIVGFLNNNNHSNEGPAERAQSSSPAGQYMMSNQGYQNSKGNVSRTWSMIQVQLQRGDSGILNSVQQGGEDPVQLQLEFKVNVIEWDSRPALMIQVTDSTQKIVNSKLKELDVYKEELLYTMQHISRTPLNSIINFSEMLLDNFLRQYKSNGGQPSSLQETSHVLQTQLHKEDSQAQMLEQQMTVQELEEIVEKMHIIKNNGQILLHTINTVTDLSVFQTNKGKLDINTEIFSLKMVFDEIRDLYLHQIQVKNLSFNVILPNQGSDILCCSDRNRIVQVLLEVIGNAIKYTLKGGITLKVKEHENGLLWIKIEDTGEGMSEELKDSLFSKNLIQYFSRERDFSKKSSAGIGLDFSRKIVGILGPFFQVFIKSSKGKGSTFKFLLYKDYNDRDSIDKIKLRQRIIALQREAGGIFTPDLRQKQQSKNPQLGSSTIIQQQQQFFANIIPQQTQQPPKERGEQNSTTVLTQQQQSQYSGGTRPASLSFSNGQLKAGGVKESNTASMFAQIRNGQSAMQRSDELEDAKNNNNVIANHSSCDLDSVRNSSQSSGEIHSRTENMTNRDLPQIFMEKYRSLEFKNYETYNFPQSALINNNNNNSNNLKQQDNSVEIQGIQGTANLIRYASNHNINGVNANSQMFNFSYEQKVPCIHITKKIMQQYRNNNSQYSDEYSNSLENSSLNQQPSPSRSINKDGFQFNFRNSSPYKEVPEFYPESPQQLQQQVVFSKQQPILPQVELTKQFSSPINVDVAEGFSNNNNMNHNQSSISNIAQQQNKILNQESQQLQQKQKQSLSYQFGPVIQFSNLVTNHSMQPFKDSEQDVMVSDTCSVAPITPFTSAGSMKSPKKLNHIQSLQLAAAGNQNTELANVIVEVNEKNQTTGMSSPMKFGKGTGIGNVVSITRKSERKSTQICQQLKIDDVDSKLKASFPEKCFVLGVDDNVFNLNILEMIFKKCSNVIFHKASNGEECLKCALSLKSDHNASYKLFLMDIQMPIMDGFQAHAELKKLMQEQRIDQAPVFAVTAYANEKLVCIQEGMEGFVEKPINLKLLYNLIYEYFSKNPPLLAATVSATAAVPSSALSTKPILSKLPAQSTLEDQL